MMSHFVGKLSKTNAILTSLGVRGDNQGQHERRRRHLSQGGGGVRRFVATKGTFRLYVLCAKFFADVIKANGVTVSNRVDKPNSPVIFEAEATIFRNSPLVRKAIEELAEEDGLPEPFSERLEIRRNRSSQSDRIEGD